MCNTCYDLCNVFDRIIGEKEEPFMIMWKEWLFENKECFMEEHADLITKIVKSSTKRKEINHTLNMQIRMIRIYKMLSTYLFDDAIYIILKQM